MEAFYIRPVYDHEREQMSDMHRGRRRINANIYAHSFLGH